MEPECVCVVCVCRVKEREREGSRGMVLLWWLCIDCYSSSSSSTSTASCDHISRSLFFSLNLSGRCALRVACTFLPLRVPVCLFFPFFYIPVPFQRSPLTPSFHLHRPCRPSRPLYPSLSLRPFLPVRSSHTDAARKRHLSSVEPSRSEVLVTTVLHFLASGSARPSPLSLRTRQRL